MVRDRQRRNGRNGEWIKEWYRLHKLIRDGKRKYWEDFSIESGEKSLEDVVRWARDR